MIAWGFILLVVGYVFIKVDAEIDGYGTTPLTYLSGIIFFSGLGLAVAGIAKWLWIVAP